jgi:polysaccharide export outer membrane protein
MKNFLISGLFKVILSVSTALVFAGCAANGPVTHDATESNSSENTEPAAGYGIGPGDSLQIFVWDHADLSTTVQVRPDGRISTPLVEDLQAAGRTPTQLARDIEGVLKEYVRTPVVTVIMQGFVGEGAQQVRVVGQAIAPQALQFRQGMTVLDVMIEVGGLSEFAAGNRAKIVRKTSDGEVEIKIRLKDLLNDGDISENVNIRPGDVLIIPQSFF